ncbi:MAG: hypothetical protein IJY20_04395 [Clostridia bacterium]|nr:hypothetical protein [Clostridia bacterium]
MLNVKEAMEQLKGRTLQDIHLMCEMLVFDFGDCAIHAQCFTRIVKGNAVLLTTLDYQNWDGETAENNDEWYHLKKYKACIIHHMVREIEWTATADLLLYLENDICIQLYVSNGLPHYVEDNEQWRVIWNKENHHIVVNRKEIVYE